MFITEDFYAGDWRIEAVGPRSGYAVDWHIKDFHDKRQRVHMTKIEVVLDWGPLVQFFGEDYIDNITVKFWNTSTFVTTTDKWPVWN